MFDFTFYFDAADLESKNATASIIRQGDWSAISGLNHLGQGFLKVTGPPHILRSIASDIDSTAAEWIALEAVLGGS